MSLAFRVTLATLVVAGFICFAFAWHATAYAAGRQCGIASFYGTESGTRTATGAYFDGRSMTAAMPSRSMLGKRVRVTYRGRSVVVLVNDLGPNRRLNRIIDLSRAAARVLGLPGIGLVCLEAG